MMRIGQATLIAALALLMTGCCGTFQVQVVGTPMAAPATELPAVEPTRVPATEVPTEVISTPAAETSAAADLAEVTGYTLCLEVEQSYPEIEGKRPEPIAEAARRILTRLGFQVVADGTPCEATLSLSLAGRALGGNYIGGGYCYTGAEFTGQMTFAAPNQPPLSAPISWTDECPQYITWCPRKPEDAPFSRAWSRALLEGLNILWGLPVLTAGLSDEEPRVRLAAVAMVREMGPHAAEAIPALVHLLGDEDYEVVRDTEAALEEIGSVAVPTLIQALGDENWEVRTGAAGVLGRIEPRPQEAVPALTQALEDESESVRQAAAGALRWFGPQAEEAVPALVHALKDESWLVRRAAAEALGWIEPQTEEVTVALLEALEDERHEVRRDAARALGSIGLRPDEVVPALIRVLQDENCEVRGDAAKGLAEFGPEARSALSSLVHILSEDQCWYARAQAIDALGSIGAEPQEVVPALVQALEDADPLVRRSAAEALGAIGPQAGEAIPALIQVLGDEVEAVREGAAEALESITGQDFGEDAARWQQWWSERQ